MSRQRLLNDLERSLLNRIQCDFPLVKEPYDFLASDYDATQNDIFRTVCSLREKGIIRRIGASYVPGHLGYSTTLVSANVSASALKNAALCAAAFPEVTHNYERLNAFNLWFTVIASSNQRLEHIIDAVSKAPGVQQINILPSCKTFKLKVHFNFDDLEHTVASNDRLPDPQKTIITRTSCLSELHKPLIARTCGDIGTGLTPYCDLAKELSLSCDSLLKLLQSYKEAGIMRRFGAILQHQAAGFNGNAMVVWQVPDAKVDDIGRYFATLSQVSHCYQRETAMGWPFNLYTMVHGQTRSQVADLCANMAESRGIDNYQILFSGREFKKTSMIYFPEEV